MPSARERRQRPDAPHRTLGAPQSDIRYPRPVIAPPRARYRRFEARSARHVPLPLTGSLRR